MHDKLKLLLDKINLPEDYYNYFINGKILKLKLDHTRKNGVFVIEIENKLEKDVVDFINNNIKNGFPDMDSIKAEFIIRNVDYNDVINYYLDAIENSNLAKPMKELFKEKNVTLDDKKIIIELDNIAEENIFKNAQESFENYYKKIGFNDIIVNFYINEENNIYFFNSTFNLRK